MANQEATATGGIVNFRIRKAPQELTLNAIAQGGYNGLRETYKDYKLSVGGSNRFFTKSLGLYAQFDYEQANRGSQQLGGVNFSQENLEAPIRTNSVQLMDILRDVERIGAAAVLDYSLASTEIKFSNFFSRINTEEIVNTNTYDFTQQNFNIGYSDTPERSLTIMTNSFQIDQRWRNLELNALLSHSYSKNSIPNQLSSGTGWPEISGKPFSENRTTVFNVDLDPETIPDSIRSSIDDASYFMTLGGITHREYETIERDLTADLNLSYSFNLLSDFNIKVSIGAKYRHKNKEHNRNSLIIGGPYYLRMAVDTYRDELSPRVIQSFESNDQFLYIENFWDPDFTDRGFLDDRYQFSPVMDSEKFRHLHDLGMAEYDPKNPSIGLFDLIRPNFIDANFYDYNGQEDYHAFYLMPEINLGRDILIVPGVRYEANRTEYTGYRGNRLGILREWQRSPVDTVTKVRNNNFILPMVQLFYKPTDWLTLKAGYTHTLQRPNYNNIMPGWVITNQGQIDNLSNFRLKPEMSRNWDLQLSFHSDKIGLFSIGAFHKKITDMIFWTGMTVITDTTFFDLPTIMNRQRAAYAVNNPYDAKNYGFEIEYQSNFWFLPGLLSGLVLNVNYTRNKSEAEYLRSVVKVEIDPITYRSTSVSYTHLTLPTTPYV
jgi:TonB-dependent receptor